MYYYIYLVFVTMSAGRERASLSDCRPRVSFSSYNRSNTYNMTRRSIDALHRTHAVPSKTLIRHMKYECKWVSYFHIANSIVCK